MKVLGLSAFHRDAAAALVVDGRPLAAEKQERFTKKPRDSSFPRAAARATLELTGLASRDLDRVVFYEKPLVKFERLLASQLAAFPRSSKTFADTMFLWLGDRLWLKNRIATELDVAPEKVVFCEHHRAHASMAYLPSPFEDAAILCVDDFGEWATTSFARGQGSQVEMLAEIRFPHSLGLVASAFTQFLGFEPGADEAKLEALAALGQPRFARELDELVRAKEGGRFEVDRTRFRFSFDGARLYDDSLAELVGPSRVSGAQLRVDSGDSRDADLAASVQELLETRVLELARELHRRTGAKSLCFTGQLAENRRLNARLAADGPFESLWIPPEPDEAGAALGAALAIEHTADEQRARWRADHVRLGSALDDVGHDGARSLGATATAELARRLTDGRTVAWLRGRAEFARSSRGSRSVFAAASRASSRRRLHGALRQSEDFLPGRLVMPVDRAGEYIATPRGAELAAQWGWFEFAASDALRRAVPEAGARVRADLVDRAEDPELHDVLTRVGESCGAPILWQANFEMRGSPCVQSESDALDAYQRSTLDDLVVEDRLYERAGSR